MKVLLVSAIFQSSADFRATNLQESSETLLASGLREIGVDVHERGHSLRNDWRDFDVVHIHHLANSCVSLFLPQRPRIVFTRHATKHIPVHHRIVLRRTYDRADAVVVLSETERTMTTNVRADKVHVIHNGLNGVNFTSSLRSAPDRGSRWRLLYVGQLVELKRVEQAIRLVADLVGAGFDVQLDIVSHRDTLRAELEKRASDLSVENRVNFLGPRTRQDLGILMAKSHLLVLPSRTEALPTVVTEAAYSGLPVAAYRVGGVSEQLPANMRLPEIHDYDGFRSLAQSQLTNYAAVARTFHEHTVHVRSKFSTDGMVRDHMKLYSQIVESGV